MVPKMLKFVGVVVLLWFVVLCYLGPTMFQLMEESRRASSELNRINKAIEHLQDSNAKLRRGIVDGDSMIHKDTAGTLYIFFRLSITFIQDIKLKFTEIISRCDIALFRALPYCL